MRNILGFLRLVVFYTPCAFFCASAIA